MSTEQINHDPAHGREHRVIIAGRPSMGSWVLYGLGSKQRICRDHRTGFIGEGRADAANCGAPVVFQFFPAGFRASGSTHRDPVLYINNPPGVDARLQDASIRAVNELDKIEYGTLKDPEILTRIAQYEMAFKMQSACQKA